MAKSKFDTTEPMPIGYQKHLEHNRIMKILRKAKHPIEFIPSWDWERYRKVKDTKYANLKLNCIK